MKIDKEPPRSICILRLSAIGDVTHVIPVINAIRAKWPSVEITWVCGKLEYKLLQYLPDIKFVVFDKQGGFGSYRKVRDQLSGQKFDVLLQMQLAARANILSLLIKAETKIGWDRQSSKDLHHLVIDRSIKYQPKRHQVQTFLGFARALGVNVEEPAWNITIPDEASKFAEDNLAKDKKTLLISPCSSHPLRNWTSERYAKVADFAIEQLGMQVILSGGPSDLEKATGGDIEAAMKQQPLNLIGKDTLIQLLAMLKGVDVVISPDSGPVHMANAVGTKVIGLFACSDPNRVGPYNSLDCCIDHFPDAVHQFAHTSVDEMRWGKKIELPGVMELIEVDEVCSKLESIVRDQL